MKNLIPSTSAYLVKDEALCIENLVQSLDWNQKRSKRVQDQAAGFITYMRGAKRGSGELEVFLQQYALNTDEGLALMCLAEALLRVPDPATADALIKDKITAANWGEAKKTADWVVRAAGLGLVVTRGTLESALERIGAPFIREAINKAMKIMGAQFVLGETIESAMKNGGKFEKAGYRFSYDMLGEGARTSEDAQRYFEAYVHAIQALAKSDNASRPGVSVKLSALHPRYEFAQAEICVPEMQKRLLHLCQIAADHNIALTVDAEEVDRLEISMHIIDHIFKQKPLAGWDGFGMAVQAYQKRALPFVAELVDRCKKYKRQLVVRLVKGAYWDTEIKRAQVLGLSDYAVFTRKCNTDLSYLACADQLLKHGDYFMPKFGTHNAFTASAVMDLASHHKANFELQRLHGMGETLFTYLIKECGVQASIYAPVGLHADLLAYLVRRLLENGANSSFVNQVMDEDVSLEHLVRDPVFKAQDYEDKKHPEIPYPRDLYRMEKPQGRDNSAGIDLHDALTVQPLLKTIQKSYVPPSLKKATQKDIDGLFNSTGKAFTTWMNKSAQERAGILDVAADLFEENMESLMHICVHEAGKTIADSVDEVREAIDFLRYYANRGRTDFVPHILPGPTGELNQIHLRARGTFVCISPWNFPLAIFTGQVAAALMAGNCVIAKPASQTPHIAHEAVRLMHKAGVPKDVLHLFIAGGVLGAKLVEHADTAGVAFTGSTEVAWTINRSLAAKDGPIVPLIAETGGQNVMFVDSSSLPEQVVDDVVRSAFGSAGQRCSALRILCLQDDAADKVIHMLKGAMAELVVGNPAQLSTDIGPVIDAASLEMLQAHRLMLEDKAGFIAAASIAEGLEGDYFAPCAYEIDDVGLLEQEVFGPVLHVLRYKRSDLNKLMAQINGLGYGLTCGVHSRIETVQEQIAAGMDVGNVYINRTMIGAVVGSQPFGGMGLSGTGPKAGGPNYLHAFATEQTLCVDTTAAGGNTALVSLGE